MEEGKSEAKLDVDGSVVEQATSFPLEQSSQCAGHLEKAGAPEKADSMEKAESLEKPDSPEKTNPLDEAPSVEPLSAWRAVASLFNLHWWRDALTVVFEYAPSCIVPAVFSALSSAVVTIAVMAFYERLSHNPVDLSDLLLAMATLLMGGLLGITFLVLGFGGWLVRLSALSITLVRAPSLAALAGLTKDARGTAFKSARKEVEPKKIYIGSVLLWVSAYMLLPLILVMVCTMVKMLTMPSVMGAMALRLPAWVDYASVIAVLPNFLFLLIFSFVSLVVAACSALKPQKTAHFAFKLSWRFFWPLSIASVFFAVLSFALGAPSDLLQVLSVEKIVVQYDPGAKVLSQVWSSALSLVLFPLSFVPICDILRPQLRDAVLSGNQVQSIEPVHLVTAEEELKGEE